MTVSRRTFLQQSAALLAATACVPRARGMGNGKRVLVAGAGAAGLCAAYELQRAGHDVQVFEAKAIPGGRIHTLRTPFSEGQYAEAGAMFVADAHTLTMDYARQFGLPLVEVTFRADLGSVAYVDGHRLDLRPGRPVKWPLRLKPEETDLALGALQRRYHYAKVAELPTLGAHDWPRAEHLQYDDLSIADFWRRQGASDNAVRIMRLRYFDGFGDGVDSVSALMALRDSGSLAGARKFYRIDGGTDLLANAFAGRLSGRIHYGAPVVAIHQTDADVEITVEERGRRRHVRGDYLVTTIPFPVLRTVQVTPEFSAIRQRAIREIPMTSISRVFVQCRSRFWEAQGNDGSAVTDLPVQQIHHPTMSQPGARGILESYTAGARARWLAALTPDARIDAVITEMAKVHPGIESRVESATSYCWDNDPWARGDFAYFKPGQIRTFFPHVQRPEGRIFFAGDMIGGISGYMQGAFLSGQAAAQRIASLA